MKKFLLSALALITVAALSITGTIAWLQDDDSDVNVMTVGSVYIEQHEYERVIENGAYKKDTIDGKSSYVLQPFTQGKALLPATALDANGNVYNYGAGDWDTTTTVRMSQVGSYGGMDVFENPNAQDKFVVVENTGKSDAYVRTLVALEVGSTDGSLIGTSYHSTWTQNLIGVISVDNNNYYLIEYIYKGAAGIRHDNGILPAGDTSYPSLSQVYLNAAAKNEDMVALDGNKNGTFDILVVSQAVQVTGFDSAEQALNAGFGDITTTNHPWKTDAPVFNAPQNDAELEDALKDENAKQIIVNLTNDVTYDVAAWSNDAMGGEKTEYIMINGNGHTITFNQTNTDWNNIVTNGAKLIINNAKITNAGRNDGPWNRHDLNFACEVELNNVTSDKALAFKAGAALRNVTINDANDTDTYAIWIQPNGQTVNIDGLTVDMIACNDGRGIKIDEQYLTNPAKVTLNVSNATFKTEEKAAILVKSKAGADINLNNVNIYGVAADPLNAVWVDEASASYADLVTVTGGNKIVEGAVTTTAAASKTDLQDTLKDAATNGVKNVVINANGQTMDMNYGLNKDTVPAGTTVTICNANVSGRSYGNGVAGTVVFENCTFENPNGAYSIHFDSGSGHVVFNNCTLVGWCSFGTAIKSVEMNNCTILGNGIYAMCRFYQPTTMNNCTVDCSNTVENDVYVDGLSVVSSQTLTLNNCELIYSDLEAGTGCKIIADGSVLVDAASDYKLVENENR